MYAIATYHNFTFTLCIDYRSTHPRWWILVGLTSLMIFIFIWTQKGFEANERTNKLRHSNTLPRIEDQVFIGREKELNNIMRKLSSSTRIISITGSPGFGKSSLAIHAGYRSEKLGNTVYYVDISQVSNVKSLKEILREVVSWEDRQSHPSLSGWLMQLSNKSLLIIDNCDLILHKEKDNVQTFLKSMTKQSSHIKVILTAQQLTSFIGSFWRLPVKQLMLKDAIMVLQSISPKITSDFAKRLAKLVGEVPLALQVVGTLLKEQNSETLYNALKQDLIRTLSPEELPPDERVATTLNISYHYLNFKFQVCGRILANFPSSFRFEPAHDILKQFGETNHPLPDPWEHSDTNQCLDILRRRSLLSVDLHRHTFLFHQLIRNFFKYKQEKEDQHPWLSNYPEVLFELAHIRHYLADVSALVDTVLRNSEETEATYKHYIKFHQERENYHFDYKHVEGFMSYDETILGNTTDIAAIFNVSVLIWKIFVLRNPILLRKINAQLYGIIATYETIHQRWHLKEEGAANYLSKYVKLLISLSKIECALHNSSYALHNYIMKYRVVLEFYSNASVVNETSSDSSLIKYLSRLAHLYLIKNQFDGYMESWQEILHIRMKKCQKAPCNRLNLGLKAFGNGKYGLTIKYLQPYLKSSRISFTRKARIFVLVHHSHIMQGNLAAAQKMLEDDFKFDFKFYRIPLSCHNHQSCTAIQENLMVPVVDTSNSIVNSLLGTRIVRANYRTYIILAKFYIHWKIYDIGIELMHRVLFFLNTQTPQDTIRRSTLIKILWDESLQKLLDF